MTGPEHAATEHAATVRPHARVTRATRASRIALAVAAIVILAAPVAPYVLDKGTQGSLVTLFALITMATMWNLLAGYGGMLSVGQQAYIGIGAYALVYLSDTVGLDPFVAVPLAVLVAGALAYPISFLAFRLSGGYFAIGTWVIAIVVMLVVQQIPALGGGIGQTFAGFSHLAPGRRIAYVYWLALVGVVLTIAVTYLIMRSRLGLGFTAIRDDPTAAAALGVRVTHSKRFVFVVSAMGCGLAGAMITANTLRVQPDSIFSVNYSIYMIFIVVIGGLGTIEGPILGAIIFFVLQQRLADLGPWYLIILGVVAIAVTLALPRGLWGLIDRNNTARLFPTGYRLVATPVSAQSGTAPGLPGGRGDSVVTETGRAPADETKG